MANVHHYWPWQQVYWYGIAAGYVRNVDEQEVSSLLHKLLMVYAPEYGAREHFQWLEELEAAGAIKATMIKFDSRILDKYFEWEWAGETLVEAGYKDDIKTHVLNKKYKSFTDIIDDKDAGYEFLPYIATLNIVIENIGWIEEQLQSYLSEFTKDDLSSNNEVQPYSFSFQKKRLMSVIQAAQDRYGSIIPITSTQLSDDDHDPCAFNFTEMLFSLDDERLLNVLTMDWKGKRKNIPLFSAKVTVLEESQSENPTILKEQYMGLEFDDLEVFYGNKPIELQPRQAAVFIKLLEKQGAVALFSELIDVYYSQEIDQDKSRLDSKQTVDLLGSIYTAIGEIRKRLAQYPELKLEVKTVSKTGYRILKKI